MKTLEILGIDTAYADSMNNKLNQLLSDYQVHYQNLRGLHWNIRGRDFFELHVKFEEIYNGLAMNIDEIAERIATLGATPLHTFADYIATAKLPVVKDISNGKEAVEAIINSNKQLINDMRGILDFAGENNDEGTVDMVSTLIAAVEKDSWMLASWMRHQ